MKTLFHKVYVILAKMSEMKRFSVYKYLDVTPEKLRKYC